jgi:hypothetical protein
MARVTKSRARAPLADGALSISYGVDATDANASPKRRFTVAVMADHRTANDRGTWFRTDLDHDEALRFVTFVAQMLTEQRESTGTPGITTGKQLSAADALRALADSL